MKRKKLSFRYNVMIVQHLWVSSFMFYIYFNLKNLMMVCLELINRPQTPNTFVSCVMFFSLAQALAYIILNFYKFINFKCVFDNWQNSTYFKIFKLPAKVSFTDMDTLQGRSRPQGVYVDHFRYKGNNRQSMVSLDFPRFKSFISLLL